MYFFIEFELLSSGKMDKSYIVKEIVKNKEKKKTWWHRYSPPRYSPDSSVPLCCHVLI